MKIGVQPVWRVFLLTIFSGATCLGQVTLPEAPPTLSFPALPAPGTDPADVPSPSVERLIEEGQQLQREVAKLQEPQARVNRLLAAIEKYRQATLVDAEAYEAHLFWGVALRGLAALSQQPAQQQKLVAQADERFAIASRCPAADARVYPEWADLILRQMLPLTRDPASRDTAHEKLIEVTRRGAAALEDGSAAQRALLLAVLGQTLVIRAQTINTGAGQEESYREAIAVLEQARENDTVRRNTDFSDKLGLAYLRLGALKDETELLEHAVTIYQDLLKLAPRSVVPRYNLACALALLGRAEETVDQLRELRVTDQMKDLLETAQRDPDMASIRDSDAFQELLRERETLRLEAKVEQLLQLSKVLQQEAARTADPGKRVRNLREAASRYKEALEIFPDDYRANRGLGICLTQLTGATRERARQRALAGEAVEHLKKAIESDESDGPVFLDLTSFYLNTYHTLVPDEAENKQLLEEAIELGQRGLEKAGFSGDIAQLHAVIGEAATRRALMDKEPRTQKAYYLQAIEAFEAAAELEKIQQQLRLNEVWGVALLRISALTGNKLYTRRAIERFRFALEQAEDSPGLNYNLSCAYAMLGDTRMWQKFYQRCAEHDTQGVFQKAALTDADLDGIRHTPEYEQVFGESIPPEQLVAPSLSR